MRWLTPLLLVFGLFVAACSDQETPTEPVGQGLDAVVEPGMAGSVDYATGDSGIQPGSSEALFTVVGPASLAPIVFNTDFVASGVGGMRNTPVPHTITVGGVSGPVAQALMYWHGPTNTGNPTANANVFLNGNPVTGTNIGFSADNCWGFVNSQAYVADVTAYVPGDGAYSLTGFGFGSVNTNGASLVVFYDDGDGTNNRDVVLFEGNDSNVANAFDPFGWTVTLGGILYTGGTADLQLHIADGQDYIDDALRINGVVKIPTINWVTGYSVPGLNNGPIGNGRLWDIINVDVTADLVAAGPAPQVLNVTTGLAGDCLSLVVAAVDLPAGAAPGNVDVDVKPGSDPNCVNDDAKGRIAVAILSTDLFDPTSVDPATVRIEPVEPVKCSANKDVGGTTALDLVCHFKTRDLRDAGLLTDGNELVVTGETWFGTPIYGSDVINLAGGPYCFD